MKIGVPNPPLACDMSFWYDEAYDLSQRSTKRTRETGDSCGTTAAAAVDRAADLATRGRGPA